jgi:hypothetical protein
MYCMPLTWQEQESLGHEAYLTALPGALCFCVFSGCKLDHNNNLFAGLTDQYIRVHRTRNSAIYKSTACANIKGMCCYQGMLYNIDFLLLVLSSAKIVS